MNCDSIPTISCIFPLIQSVITWAIIFAGVVALVLIIYSGAKLIVSGGDVKKIEEGKKTFTYAILGLFLVLLSFAIINLIAYVTGVDCIKIIGIGACPAG